MQVLHIEIHIGSGSCAQLTQYRAAQSVAAWTAGETGKLIHKHDTIAHTVNMLPHESRGALPNTTNRYPPAHAFSLFLHRAANMSRGTTHRSLKNIEKTFCALTLSISFGLAA